MAAGGRLIHEARAERLLLKILPEVSMTEEADRSPSPPPFKVPDGLRTLLNELSKEVIIVPDKYWYKNNIEIKNFEHLIFLNSMTFLGSEFATQGTRIIIHILCRLFRSTDRRQGSKM